MTDPRVRVRDAKRCAQELVDDPSPYEPGLTNLARAYLDLEAENKRLRKELALYSRAAQKFPGFVDAITKQETWLRGS